MILKRHFFKIPYIKYLSLTVLLKYSLLEVGNEFFQHLVYNKFSSNHSFMIFTADTFFSSFRQSLSMYHPHKIFSVMGSSKSLLTYTMNSIGPRTVPCGISNLFFSISISSLITFYC